MSITRGSVLRGPAIIEVGSTSPKTIRTAGDIRCNMRLDTFDIPSSEYGNIDQRRNNVVIELSFTPVGTVDADMLALFLPHLSLPIGGSLFGASDTKWTIKPVAGPGKIELHAAAVTKMPDLVISATKTSFGEVTVTALLKNATEWDNAAARYTYTGSGSALSPAAISTAAIPTIPASVTWGTILSGIKTQDGVTVSFDMETNEEESDEDGIFDVTLRNLQASAKFTPVSGATESALVTALGLQGTGILRGTSTTGADLTIAAVRPGGLQVVIPSARLAEVPLTWGMESRRFGELTFRGYRTSGAAATVSIVPESETQGDG